MHMKTTNMDTLIKKYEQYLKKEFCIVMDESQLTIKKNDLIRLSGGNIDKAKFILYNTISRGEIMFSQP